MKLHRNAALSWSGRRLLVDRVLVQGWTLRAAAEAAGVSVRYARKWVGRYRLEGAPFREPNADSVVHFYYVRDLLEEILRERGDELAAVVVAPDYVHISPEAVADLFDLARSSGVPTVCDDVKYGYRMRMGPSLEGVEPNLLVYAKGIGNGWPVACVLGAADAMAPLRPATSSLTFDAPTAAAVLATLARLRELDAQAAIAREAGVFLAECRRRIAARRLPIEIAGSGNAFQLVAEQDVGRDLVAHALAAGLVFEPEDQQLPSAAFTAAVVAEAVERFDRALERLASARPELIGAGISESARLEAAWTQMDGAPERGWALDEALSFLEPRVREACAAA